MMISTDMAAWLRMTLVCAVLGATPALAAPSAKEWRVGVVVGTLWAVQGEKTLPDRPAGIPRPPVRPVIWPPPVPDAGGQAALPMGATGLPQADFDTYLAGLRVRLSCLSQDGRDGGSVGESMACRH